VPPEERFAKFVTPAGDACWLWAGTILKSGYGNFGVGGGKTEYAHRFSYRLYVGDIPPGMEVCHSCDVRACANPDHLFVGTRKDNVDDCIAKGRNAKGERMANAKLTDDDVVLIRASLKSDRELAVDFDVSPSRVNQVRNRLGWRHVI